MTDVDNKIIKLIVADIISNITKTSLNKKDLKNIGTILKTEISEKKYKYTEAQVTSVIDQLIATIAKTSFSKNDILDAQNEILIENTLEKPFEKIFSEAETIVDKIMVVINIMVSSVLNLVDDYILLFLATCIVLSFQDNDRSSDDIYPSNYKEPPYVNHTPGVNDYTTTLERIGTGGEAVFGHVPIPEGRLDNDSKKPLNIFAKLFMDNNADKTENELNIFGMISYVLLFTYQYTNSILNSVDSSIVKPIGRLTKVSAMFFIFVVVLYLLFLTNQSALTSLFGPMISVDFKASSTTSIGGTNIMTSFLNVLSTFFAPFLTFFYFIFIIAYIGSLIGCIIGYWNYANCSTSYFVKLLCFVGGLTYPVVLIAFIIALSSSNGNVKELFQNIFNTLKTKALSYVSNVQSLESQATDLENEVISNFQNMSDNTSGNTSDNTSDNTSGNITLDDDMEDKNTTSAVTNAMTNALNSASPENLQAAVTQMTQVQFNMLDRSALSNEVITAIETYNPDLLN
jgi:hypothetical protein